MYLYVLYRSLHVVYILSKDHCVLFRRRHVIFVLFTGNHILRRRHQNEEVAVECTESRQTCCFNEDTVKSEVSHVTTMDMMSIRW